MKACSKCREVKPIADFYRGAATCKPCYRQRVRENRAARIEQYREYDRRRGDLAHRVAARKRVAKDRKADPIKRSADRARLKRWQDRNFVKRRAHIITGNAIRDGYLAKPNRCERCGASCNPNAHHEDYYRPLEVTWLCDECHGLRHREINEEIRAGADLRCRGFETARAEQAMETAR